MFFIRLYVFAFGCLPKCFWGSSPYFPPPNLLLLSGKHGLYFFYRENMRSPYYNPQHLGLKRVSPSNMQIKYFMRKKTIQNPTCRALIFNLFVYFFGSKQATWKMRGPGPGVRGAVSRGVENTECGGKN